MKKVIMAALVFATACTKAENNTTHEAVIAHLKMNLNDPASYEAARWGLAQPFTRRDSVKAVLAPIMTKPGYAGSQGGFVDKMLASSAFRDTARVGTRFTHAYRAKNKLGALVLDSAQFVVYKNGKVQPL